MARLYHVHKCLFQRVSPVSLAAICTTTTYIKKTPAIQRRPLVLSRKLFPQNLDEIGLYLTYRFYDLCRAFEIALLV